MGTIPEDAKTLGAWLAGLRETADLTQAELSQATGVAVRTIQRWEAGEHAPVDAIRILTALGVTFTPPEPDGVRALNASVAGLLPLIQELEALRSRVEADGAAMEPAALLRRLESLEAAIESQGQSMTEALKAVSDRLEQLDEHLEEDQGTSESTRALQARQATKRQR